jgi:hypothetical protein
VRRPRGAVHGLLGLRQGCDGPFSLRHWLETSDYMPQPLMIRSLNPSPKKRRGSARHGLGRRPLPQPPAHFSPWLRSAPLSGFAQSLPPHGLRVGLVFGRTTLVDNANIDEFLHSLPATRRREYRHSFAQQSWIYVRGVRMLALLFLGRFEHLPQHVADIAVNTLGQENHCLQGNVLLASLNQGKVLLGYPCPRCHVGLFKSRL